MKLITERAHLLAALKAVAHLADGKAKIPALAHVRLVARESRLFIAATDLDCWAEAHIPAEISERGEIAVPAAQIHKVVQNFAEGTQVYLELSGALLTVKAGRSRYQLPTWPGQDFPGAFDAGEDAAYFELMPEEVMRLLDITRPAAPKGAKDLPHLEGVFLKADAGASPPVLVGAAASIYAMLAVDVPLPPGADALPRDKYDRAGVMLPLSCVEHLVKLGDAGLDVEIGANVITVRTRGALNVRYSSRLIENSFPPFERVIPACEGPHVEVAGGELAAAVKRLAAMAGDDQKRAIAIEWGTEGDLSLWLDDAADSAFGTETIDIVEREGELRAGLQWHFFSKAIEAVGHGRLKIYGRPGKNIRFFNMDDPALIACVAPLKLRRPE